MDLARRLQSKAKLVKLGQVVALPVRRALHTDYHGRLPMPLYSLQGPKARLKDLQVALREIEQGESEGTGDSHVEELESLHEKFINAGTTKEKLREKIQMYLAGEVHSEVVEALDARLLACHDVLLEDLSEPLLEGFLQDVKRFQSPNEVVGGGMDQVREELYGPTALPILTSDAKAKACFSGAEPRRRQLVIERVALNVAYREFLESQRHLEELGKGSARSGVQQLCHRWVKTLAELLKDEQCALRQGKGSRAFKELQNCGLAPDLMAILASQTLLNLIFLPNYRHKDDLQADARAGKYGEVPFVTIATQIGEAVQMERYHLDAKINLKDDPGGQQWKQRWRQAAYTDARRTVQFGSCLADMLIEYAEVDLAAHQVASSSTSASPRLVKAFNHRLRREGKKKVGVVSLDPQVRAMVDEVGLWRFIHPKHKPMILPPAPWRPGGFRPQGPYLIHKVEFVRTNAQQLTNLPSYNPTSVARVMDFLGQVPWKVNGRILRLMRQVQLEDLGIAGVPLQKDPEVPKLPAEDEELTDAERKDRRIRHFNAQRLCRELQSERPTFELKLQVAEEFLHAEKVYFPHNVDFRGRSYPIPPHLNHIGDDVSRGLLQFAEGKALGPEGLFWLKVNLANLFGKNKVSLEDRAAWVDAQRETIVKVVKDPLKAENVEWWSKADDGPWQALARCFELEEIWASPRPQEYISHLPVHMDGSCNGLQHYAALGRDVKGGEAVNLVPAEKPQDVYTVVLNVVKRKVQEDADSTDESKEVKRVKARRLQELDVLQRKVVKQTIMTICYGVTRLGAMRQVQGQLEDSVGEKVEAEEIKALAVYLSGMVLNSIEDVFSEAKKIQTWFEQISKLFNCAEAPISWISPVGLACAQPYHKPKVVVISSKRQTVSLRTGDDVPINKNKQRMGFPPNFIHSLDASHMMMVAERCQQRQIAFAAVHDSFWSHAADIPVLNEEIREAFIELYQKPVLQDLYEDLCVHLGGPTVPEVPLPGELDVSVVRESRYLFS